MAIASWLTVAPTTGNGDGTISNSTTSEYTGRNSRDCYVTVTATGVSESPRYHVIQTGKPEFTDFTSSTKDVAKDGGSVTISGRSNSSKLTFSWKNNQGLVDAPTAYKVNTIYNATSGTAISGDPGASGSFMFRFTLDYPANETINARTHTLVVTDNANNVSEVEITQAAGNATLELSSTAINIPQAGTAQTIEVQANCSWTVS